MSIGSPESRDLERFDSEFIVLADKISDFARKAGKTCMPYSSTDLPFFSGLNPEQKRSILNTLRTRLEWIRFADKNGADLSSSKQILWHVLKASGLRPMSDLMEYLTDDCVVEVHWLHDLSQMFHSFSFYEYSSYTIEELTSVPWQDLYDVDLSVQQGIFNLAEKMLKGEVKKTFDPELGSYCVKELSSIYQYIVDIKYKYVSPVFDKNGRPVAAISVEDMKLLGQRYLSPQEEEELLVEKIGVGEGPTPII